MNETHENQNPYPVTVAVPSSEKYAYTRGTRWFITIAALFAGAALAAVITFLAVGWSDSVTANRYKANQITTLQSEYKDLYNEFIETTKQRPDSPSPAQVQKAVGEQGPRGLQGLPGDRGPAGADGQPGAPGAAGQPGLDGKDGVDGKDGADGAPGKDGVDGQPGPQGPQGTQGEKGDKGDQGPAGPSCPNGMTLQPITVTTLTEGQQNFYACK